MTKAVVDIMFRLLEGTALRSSSHGFLTFECMVRLPDGIHDLRANCEGNHPV
jgi:hypothetical protein